MADSDRYSQSRAWFERAEAVIPGGVYGHQSPAMLTRGSYPFFITEAEGCRLRDPDGNEYIDFLCSYGPIVLGHAHPEVEQAAAEQRGRTNAGNLPSTNIVELAERLVSMTPGADWAMFAKNGSDVCSWSLAVARQATGRSTVAMVEGTYHGVHGWCNGVQKGFPDSDRAGVAGFSFNDLASLDRVFDRHDGDVAAVIVTPFRHEAFADQILPASDFLGGVRERCTKHGAVMIVDDVRAGFRLHLGGSTQLWGVEPDMVCYSKALANGYALAAMLGRDELREAAGQVFVTGTFFTEAVPIAAALATLAVLEREDAPTELERIGRRFCHGLSAAASARGLTVTMSGPPAIPFMSFDADAGSFRRSRRFAGVAAERGVFLHPVHNWFVSLAHGDAEIDRALEICEVAFAAVAEEFGRD